MSSPLNPNARKVGKRMKIIDNIGSTVEGAVGRAQRQGQETGDGLVRIEFHGKKFDINSTAEISAEVARVKRELGIQD